MNKPSSFRLSAYIINIPHLLKAPAIVFLFIFGIYALMAYASGGADPSYMRYGPVVALILSGFAFVVTLIPPMKNYSLTFNYLKASGDLEEAVKDLETARQVIGIGAVGQHFYFGCGTGVVLRLEQISSVIHHVRTYTDDRRTKQEHSVLFVHRSGQMLPLCRLSNNRTRKAAAEMLKLLQDKCFIDSSLLSMFDMQPMP